MLQNDGARVAVPVARPGAERTLICLSYSGGGTRKFREWASAAPDGVEVAIVCYPGRESRFNDPFARDWDELLEDVLAGARPLIDRRPYVLAGHSLGGWVAFDLAVRLARTGLRQPEGLVVSACESPLDWAARRHRSPDPDAPDDVLLAWLGRIGQISPLVLAEPDLREIALELLRADLRVGRSYRYRAEDRTTVPLQVLHAGDDHVVSAEAVRRWTLVADGTARIVELPGEHFYTDEVWATLPTRMTALAAPVTSR